MCFFRIYRISHLLWCLKIVNVGLKKDLSRIKLFGTLVARVKSVNMGMATRMLCGVILKNFVKHYERFECAVRGTNVKKKNVFFQKSISILGLA